MGITHIKYSWVNFQFKTVTQNISSTNCCSTSNGGHQGKDPDSSLERHPGSFWWEIFFAIIFSPCSLIRGLSYSTHSGLLLQLRKYDDLPHLLHEVRVLASHWPILIIWPESWPLIWIAELLQITDNLSHWLFADSTALLTWPMQTSLWFRVFGGWPRVWSCLSRDISVGENTGLRLVMRLH